jgi:maleylpyruvate isomerase
VVDFAGRLAHLRSSTSLMTLGLTEEHWTDADMRAPSLLPGWSRGHVLTHLARNADGISSTVSGALRDEIVERYPGGTQQRNADIEAGAGRSALELISDVRDSADRLDRLFAAADAANAWDAPCDNRSVGDYVTARWREVEIHWVDVAGSYQPRDWPPAFITYLITDLVSKVAERTDEALRIEVATDGSTTTDLPGQSWATPGETATEVIGPDWAVAAWLAGRGEVVRDALSSTPTLRPWL